MAFPLAWSKTERMSEKNVVITDGAGFLGSHLCDRLIDAGEVVICLDNFLTGSKKNIEHRLPNSRFKLVRRDVGRSTWR